MPLCDDSGRLFHSDQVGFRLTFGELDFLVMFTELLHQTIQLFLSICSKMKSTLDSRAHRRLTRFGSVQLLIDLLLQQLPFFFEFSQVVLHRSQTFLHGRLGLLDLSLESAFAILLG